jgi:beta-lactam-binding protein with PASTA domain
MPNLVGMLWSTARNDLLGRGLDIQVDPVEVASNEMVGIVIETIPPAGEALQRGFTVTLRYSGGPDIEMVTVPALALPTTRAALMSAFRGLDLEIVFDEYEDADLDDGTVTYIRHAGEEVAAGTVVNVSISVKPLVTVPNLPLPTTRAAIVSAFMGLDLVLTFEEFEDANLEDGTVTFVRNAGEQVPAGTRIVVSISVRPYVPQPPDPPDPDPDPPDPPPGGEVSPPGPP